MRLVFDEKTKTSEISLVDLEKTHSELDYAGQMPKSRPITHVQLINRISGMLDDNKQAFMVQPIIVSSSESSRLPILDKSGQGDIESWILRRLITTISLRGGIMEDEESNAGIAISYHNKGITIAFGQQVKVCKNMSIFGEKICFSNGSDSMPFNKMMEVLEHWIQHREKLREADLLIFNTLKSKTIMNNDASTIIGTMLRKACMQYSGEDIFIPITDVSQFTQDFQKDYKEISENGISGWDFYNIGTRIITHSHGNLAEKYKRISNFSNFIMDHLQIEDATLLN